MKTKKTYAVFGLGRYGTAVARELVDHGLEVIAVDSKEEIVNDAAAYLPICKCADVTDSEVISRLGIGNIDTVIVCMASNLEASVMPQHVRSSWIRDQACVSPALAGRFFTTEPPGNPCSFICNSKNLETKMSTNTCMAKGTMAHPYHRHYTAVERSGLLIHTACMYLKGIMLTGRIPPERSHSA